MRADKNELVTRVSPGTACGELLRRYWQPVALVDEFNPGQDRCYDWRRLDDRRIRLLAFAAKCVRGLVLADSNEASGCARLRGDQSESWSWS